VQNGMGINKQIVFITTFFNPSNNHWRIKRYFEFKDYVRSLNVDLITVEVSTSSNFKVTTKDDIQLIATQNIWHKEAALNVAINKITGYKYIAWIDADVRFESANFIDLLISKLQFFDIVQCFDKCRGLNSEGNVCWYNDGIVSNNKNGHSGLAWAAKLEAIKHVKLIDFCLHELGDIIMSHILIKKKNPIFDLHSTSDGFKKSVNNWENKVKDLKVGFIEEMCTHYWHEESSIRNQKWVDIVQSQFDPLIHLKYLDNGLLEVVNSYPLKVKLEYSN
jgi:hypothetical protein